MFSAYGGELRFSAADITVPAVFKFLFFSAVKAENNYHDRSIINLIFKNNAQSDNRSPRTVVMRHRKLTLQELNQRSLSAEALKTQARNPFYFILENIRSLHNVGSVFRTADALRAEMLILTGYTGRPPRKEIDKAALGSVESVPWAAYKETRTAIRKLKKNGVTIVALEQTTSSVDYRMYEYLFPTAVIIGNEFEGIVQETLDYCDDCIEIPMFGSKQSLNVSVAAGVVGYELIDRLK
ncbi:RNA methyltransferase [candidate division KSB1 bacterium]